MKLRQRYRRLSLWSKIGLWGSIASIAGLIIALALLIPWHTTAPYSSRDRIVADEYFMSLNLFLVTFKLNLHCLPMESSPDPRVDAAFKVGRNGVDFDKIDHNLIEYLFTKHNFSKPMVNYTPPTGKRMPTNLEWLISSLNTLNISCKDILSKYASSGDPELILEIELMENRTGNLLGSFGLKHSSGIDKNNVESLVDFFEVLKHSFKLVNTIRESTNIPYRK